jgi:transposase, IS5 family
MNNTKRYHKNTGENLFCDKYLFQEAMRSNPNTFLMKLNELVNWDKYTESCINLYKANGTLGAPMYQPKLMLKMLFLTFLFNKSDRETERIVNDSISMKNFLELAFSEAAPDHSSLSVFRNRIIKNENIKLLENIFTDIIVTAQEKGVKFSLIQVIDSTHTLANVNRNKDKQRQKPKKDGGEGKGPRDPDAKVGVKGVKKIKAKDGKLVEILKYIYGYKNHYSVNSELGLITSLKVTDASRYDGHLFKELMEKDLKIKVAKPKETIYTADKGYDDGENNAWLNQHQLKDAIFYRGMKKIKDAKVRFTTYTSQEDFINGATKRHVVERVNGDVKAHHGLGQARYIGMLKMEIQSYLTAIIHNLKTLVKSIYGFGLRTSSRF